MDVERIAPGTLVGEVVMREHLTRVLQAAQAKGCPVQVATDMLFEQIPAYLEFFGATPQCRPAGSPRRSPTFQTAPRRHRGTSRDEQRCDDAQDAAGPGTPPRR
jgi:hypothetical protein